MSQKIFDLIKTLSKNEKGYFKKYASIYSDNDSIYTKLFDQIEKQSQFDEQEIKDTLFKNHTETNYYNVVKNYLYNIILKSLRSFHSKKKISNKIAIAFNNVEILYQKKLIKQCFTELKKAKALIEKNEMFSKGNEVLIWERRLLVAKGFSSKLDEQEQGFYEQRQLYLEKESNIELYSHLQYQFFSATTQMKTNKDALGLNKIDKIMSHEKLQDDSFAISARSKILFYNIKARHADFLKDYPKYYKYTEKAVDTLLNNQFIFNDHLVNLASGFYNLLDACILINNKEKFDYYYAKLKALPNDFSKICSKELASLITLYLLEIKVEYLKRNKLYTEIVACSLTDVDMSLAKLKKLYFYSYLDILNNIAAAHFYLGEYKKADELLTEFFNHPNSKNKNDTILFVELLNILNQYELGNYKYVTNLIEGFSKRSTKNVERFQADRLTLRTITKLIKAKDDESKRLDIFKTTKEKLELLSQDPAELDFFQNIDIVNWMNSHSLIDSI